MVSVGEEGYLDATTAILETAAEIKAGIREIPELDLSATRSSASRFAARRRARHLPRAGRDERARLEPQRPAPPAGRAHRTTLRHTQPSVAERFVADLREAVAYVKAHPGMTGP